MAGLSHLRDVYDKRGKDFLEGLLNKTVIVNEKMDGAFFGAQKILKLINLNTLNEMRKLRILTGYLVNTMSLQLNILMGLSLSQFHKFQIITILVWNGLPAQRLKLLHTIDFQKMA